MTRHGSHFDPDVDAIVERGKAISPVPSTVRGRVLARAQAAMTGGTPAAVQPAPGVGRVRLRLAVAASIVLAIGAAGAVAALRLRILDPNVQRMSVPAAMPPAGTAPGERPPALPAPAPEPPQVPDARRQRPPRSVSTPESYAAELHLLQSAQASYLGRDFAGALAVLAEHDRRFPNGRLAEEREALRVRSLARAGHAEQARHAAAAFARRFPRSVLLPRLLEPENAQPRALDRE